MATNQEFKKLLVKLGINTTDWQSALKTIRASLDDLNQKELAKSAARQKAAEQETAQLQARIAVQKKAADEQAKSVQAHVDRLNVLKQSYADIQGLQAKLRAQIDLEAVSEGTVLKKRQDIIAQCEIEMEKLLKLRSPSEQQLAILQKITAERQRQLEQIDKMQAAQARRIPVYGPTQQQLGTATTAIQSEASEAAFALRLRMTQQEAVSTADVLAERTRIVAMVDKELMALRQGGVISERDIATQAKLLSLREQQIRLINQAQAAEQRAGRQVVPADTQTLARLRSQLATTEVSHQAEVKAIQTQILAILDKQIAAIREKVNLDRQDVSELNRLSSARASQARQMQPQPSESMLGGALSGFGKGLVGPVFAGVLGAEAVGGMIRGWATGIAELVQSIGQLQHLQETFQKLGAIKGTDTTKFLNQLREGTYNLVPDIELLRVANASMESGLKISTDQIGQLTHATVALALAQGHTATQAVNALDRAFLTGRFQMLGYVTGIQRAELQMQKLGGAIPLVVQRQEQFSTMLDAMNRKLLEVGEPTLTVTDRLEILRTEYERVRQSFAISLVKTEGFRSFLGFLGDIVVRLRKAEEEGRGWGKTLGEAFGAVTILAKAVITTFEQVASAVKGVGQTVGITTLKTAVLDLAIAFAGLGEAISYLTTDTAFLVREFVSFIDVRKGVKDTIEDMKQEFKDWEDQTKATEKSFTDLVKGIEALKNAKPEAPPTGVQAPLGKEQEPPPDQAFALKVARLQVQLKEALNKEDLENTKANLQAEKDANEDSYNNLKESFVQYIANKKMLRAADLQATLTEIEQDRKAKLSEIRFEEQLATAELRKQLDEAKAAKGESPEEQAGNAQRISDLKAEIGLTQSTYEIRKKIIEAQAGGQASRATTAAAQAQQQLDNELVKNHLAAVRVMAQAELDARKSALDEQRQILEDNFKDGLVSADSYLQQRKVQILAERDLQIAEAQDVYNNTEISEESKARLYLDTTKAAAEAEKQLTKLSLSEDDVRVKALESSYERIQKILTGQAKLSETPLGRSITGESEIQSIQKLIELNAAYIGQLEKQLSLVKDSPAEWSKVADEIVKVEEEQEKYTMQLAKAKDLLTPIGGLLGAIGGVVNEFNRKVGSGIQAGATTFTAMGEFSTSMGAQLGVGSNIFQGLIQTGKDAFNAMKGQVDGTTNTTSRFNAGISTATSAVSSFTNALLGAASKLSSTQAPSGGGATSTAPSGGMPILNPSQTISGLPGIPSITVPSAQGGTIVAGDTLMQVHEQEMVLPAQISTGLQKIINLVNNPTGQSGTSSLSTSSANLAQQFQLLAQTASLAANALGTVSGQTPGAPVLASQDLIGRVVGQPTMPPPPPGWTPGSATSTGGNIFSNLWSSAQKLPDAFNSSVDTAAQGTAALQGFIGALGKATSAVGGFIQSTVGAQTTTGGAISGALSGASLGSALGPWGALAGAAAGGIMGGLFGSKAEQYTDFITQMKQQFNDLIEEMNTGLMGISQTIAALEATQQQVANKNPGKNGKQAKEQTLQQMDQTLQQLQEKQQQTIQQMQQQLDTLQAPVGYQQWLGGLDSIVQQYKQFAEAAENTTQLAQAQQYLTQALQQYATTQATQVQSAEISAINNALQLNQLYMQRQQLMEQYSQQEQSILSGGVLVREQTASASKAGQLQQLDQQYTQQMSQLNQQIATSQYQYDTQQKIFNLATTQAGLQTQVVELQMNQIDQQNASIAAQENLINLIRNTPASQLQTMPQIYQLLGIPYSGPTAGQVGPQLPPNLGPTSPSYPINPQYPVYPTYPTTPTPPPWVYGPGGTITTGPSIPVTTAPQPGQYNPAPGTPGSGGIFTTTPVNGYPGTSAVYSTAQRAVTATGQPTAPYAGGTGSATAPAPIYYMQSPAGNLLPVYSTPVGFDTGTGGGATGIVPGNNPAVIPSVSAQTGIGSTFPGTAAPLQDILAYPGLTGQASTLLPSSLQSLSQPMDTTQTQQPAYYIQSSDGQTLTPVYNSPTASTQFIPANRVTPVSGGAPLPGGGTGGGGYRTTPSTVYPNPTGTQQPYSGLLPVSNVPVTFDTGPTTAPTNLGPVTGSGGPFVLEGSSTPQGMMNGLIGAISTAVKTVLPGPSHAGPPKFPGPGFGPEPIFGGGFGGGSVSPIITGPFSPGWRIPVASTNPDPSTAAHAALNNAKLTTETQITSMTSTRIAMEMKLVAAKKQQTDYEMQHVSALQQVMSSIATGNFRGLGNALKITNQAITFGGQQGPGAPTIEQNMYDLYRERGRYGSGGFTGGIP